MQTVYHMVKEFIISVVVVLYIILVFLTSTTGEGKYTIEFAVLMHGVRLNNGY